MAIEMGEYIVGACLEHVFECDVVQYNVRAKSGGVEGLNELDVIGFKSADDTAYLCEVTTHIDGVLYGSGNKSTVSKILAKHEYQRRYATKYLSHFRNHIFMYWAPRIPVGKLTTELQQIPALVLVTNSDYTARVKELRIKAKQFHQDTGNPAFRMLQILESLR